MTSGVSATNILVIIFILSITSTEAIRCYTNLEESRSLECGMATGCVKIVKRAKEFDPSTGKFVPEEKRAKSVDLFKGCFLISAPDVCFDAKDGLTYCWCSSNDLCNSVTTLSSSVGLISLLVILSVTLSDFQTKL
jgi:hypothetical protein